MDRDPYRRPLTREKGGRDMNNIISLIGLVVVLFVLSYLGLR